MTQGCRDAFIATTVLNMGLVKCGDPGTHLVTCKIVDNCTAKDLIDLRVGVNLYLWDVYKT